MALSSKTFPLTVLTPGGRVADVQAVSLVAPAADGALGILADRAPAVALLGAGRLWFEREDGTEAEFFVAGGFVHVRQDAVDVLAETCVPAERLDLRQAKEQLRQATEMPADDPQSARRRAEAMNVARARLRMAQSRRQR